MSFLHGGVPMIFNPIISPSINTLSNLSPSIPQSPMSNIQKHLLTFIPLLSLDLRIQMIMPSLSTLLSHSSWILKEIPDMCSAIIVHFWAPYFCTSLRRYSSYYVVQHRFLPEFILGYIWKDCLDVGKNKRFDRYWSWNLAYPSFSSISFYLKFIEWGNFKYFHHLRPENIPIKAKIY